MFIAHATTDQSIPAELLLIPPLLALSTTLLTSLMAGLMFILLLVVIAVSVSILRHVIAWRIRLPFVMLIIATWISVFEMVVMVYFYGLRGHFSVYLPLLACNSLVYVLSEEYYLRLPLRQSLYHAVRTGLVILLLFVTTGAFRELLSFGTLAAGINWSEPELSLDLLSADNPTGLSIANAAPGALLCLGLIFALWNYLSGIFRNNGLHA